jgi:hypothetical protein
MEVSMPSEIDGRSARLFMHFDVVGHFLRLDTFISTASSAREIVESFDQSFFNGELEYSFLILPPDDGSFLSKFAIWVGGGTAAVFSFMNTDVGAAYIEGLTGKAPIEWANELGEAHRNMLKTVQEYTVQDVGPDPKPSATSEEEIRCHASAEILAALTKGVLEKGSEELLKIGLGANLGGALNGRATFYSSCLKDPAIIGVGFDPADRFPIDRNTFAERAVSLARESDGDDELEWYVEIEQVHVTSPNWQKEDQKTRNWKGKDSLRRDCYFTIDDDAFWDLIRKKDLKVDVLDHMKVQWAYQNRGGRPKNRRVLRVLEFNGSSISEPLTDEDLIRIIGQQFSRADVQRLPSLFDLFDDDNDTETRS